MHFEPPRTAARPCRKPSERLRQALLALAGGHGTITDHREKNWASITFAGTRHRIDLVFEGAEAVEHGEVFIDRLPEHLFNIPGQLVADAGVIEVDQQLGAEPRMQVSTEVLLLEDS